MLNLRDISVIIPTYNRVDELKITLKPLLKHIAELNEIIVVDQSKNDLTKSLVKRKNHPKLKYVYLANASLPRARNLGVSKSSKSSKLIFFLDDDATISSNYFSVMLQIFNSRPNIMGAAAFPKTKLQNKVNALEERLKKMFFLQNELEHRPRVLSVYGNCYPAEIKREVVGEWISGVNMCYRKEVFEKQRFDENLPGYALAEDFDFSYRLAKKYQRSLLLTNKASVLHRFSQVERYPEKKISYTNQINHFYLNFKNFNSGFREKIIFAWAIAGISLLRVLNFVKTRKSPEALKLKFYFSSLAYTLFNLGKIRRGDLSLPSFNS